MLDLLCALLRFLFDFFRSPVSVNAENLLLRQQLVVALRHVEQAKGRPRWTRWERLVMVFGSVLTNTWREVVKLVQPETVLRWHKTLFQFFWRLQSKPKGRPPTPRAALIRHVVADNVGGERSAFGRS